jgi:arylsulfatase A-like enzyme
MNVKTIYYWLGKKRTASAVSLFLLCITLLVSPSCRRHRVAERYNILLIAVDTLRADRLGCYGYGRETSPRLDALAKQSMFFEHAFCPIPKTSASFASLMTGLLPSVHKTRPNRGTLYEKYLTLAEMLQAQGYQTAAVVDNANLSSVFKFNQGFESYTEVWNEVAEKTASSPFITARVLDFIAKPHAKPFFMWVNYIDPHSPYVPPQEFIRDQAPGRDLRTLKRAIISGRMRREMAKNGEYMEGYYIARYDGAVRYVDSLVGLILDALSRRGLDKNTVVVFVADHGEDLGERNYFFDHGSLTFTASVRIPLMVRIPGRKAETIRAPVSNMDVYPTILEMLGLDPPYEMQGVSLFAPKADRLLHILGIGTYAVVKNGQHYISLTPKTARRLKQAPEFFFDYFADPLEMRNQIGSQAAHARAFAALHGAFIKEYGDYLLGTLGQARRKLTDKEKKSLETLGYL